MTKATIKQPMTRKDKITQAKKLLAGIDEREYKAFVVIDRDGVLSCADPGYPDEVLPQDIVFHIVVKPNSREQ